MRYVLTFGAVAVTALLSAWSVAALPWRVGMGWVALSFGLAALGYAGAGGALYAKRADGSIPAWSLLVHAPFLLLGALSLWGAAPAARRALASGRARAVARTAAVAR